MHGLNTLDTLSEEEMDDKYMSQSKHRHFGIVHVDNLVYHSSVYSSYCILFNLNSLQFNE